MSFFVFLGAFFLSYFVYKFLRRFETRFFEYYLDNEDDSRKNFLASATNISAGANVLLAKPNPIKNIFRSSRANFSPHRNSIKPDQSVIKPFSLQNNYQHNSTGEDYYLMRKDKLYFSALNRSRPRKFRKLKKLPTVGIMPTIIESFPYPVPLEHFM